MKKPIKAAIIGAGITGLTAAMNLCRAGFRVSIFEKEPFAGGLCANFAEKAGYDTFERFYHHLLTSDDSAIKLFADLGLKNQLEWLPPANAFICEGKTFKFSNPVDLLRFEPVSPLRRLLTGMQILGTRYIRDWKSLAHTTAADWVSSRAGRQVYRKIWQPLLKAKFGDESERIAAMWLANKIRLRGSSQKAGFAGERLGYPRGGFSILVNAILKNLHAAGAEIFTGEPVRHIGFIPGSDRGGHEKFTLKTAERNENYDYILSTIAPGTMAELMPQQPEATRRNWKRIKYQASLCLTLELDCSLSPWYWTTVADPDYPFVAVIEHTNLIPPERYGCHIVYVSSYVNPEGALFQSSDDHICQLFETALKRLLPRFGRARILGRHLSRAEHAQPVVTLDYATMVPEIRTPVENCWMASMAQIFPEDRGVNYAIKLANEVSQPIIASERHR